MGEKNCGAGADTESAEARVPVDGTAARRTALCLPSGISLDEWQSIGKRICVAADSSTWWLGDWLIYGRSAYPDRYRRAIEETLLDYQTLRNYAWVARRYAPGRRRAALSFQHHAELASLPEHEQDHWLDRAEKLNWSRNFLRSRVKAARQGEPETPPAGRVTPIQVHILRDQRLLWARAAARSELDLQKWAMATLDDAAASVLSV